MTKSPDKLGSSGRVFLVLELVHDPADRTGYIGYMASLPGRDSVMTKTWKSPRGIITDRQLEDLSAAVTQVVTDAVVAWAGVQTGMPMG